MFPDAPAESAATDERILDAADALMHARGFEAVGLAEICAAADARKGSFYHFFESKETLAVAMLDRSWERARTELFEPCFATPGLPVVERFARYADGLVANLRRAGGGAAGVVPGCRFGNFAAEIAATRPALRERVVAVLGEMTGYYAGALRAGVEAGEVPSDLDVDATATAICAQMEGLMLLAKANADPDVVLTLPGVVERLVAAGG